MIVRPANEDDVHHVARVHVESWLSTYRGLVPDDYLDELSVEHRRELWHHLITTAAPDIGVIVIENDEGVVGFSHFAPSRDGDADAATGEITSIYLLRDHWRRGHGSHLLRATVDRLIDAGYRRATLWVLDSNHRARAFYEAQGWACDGTSKVEERRTFTLHEVRYARELVSARGPGPPWQEPDDRSIFHIAYADDWQHAQVHGTYRMSTKGRSLEDEGFVHASYDHGQIARVGEYLYAGEGRELVVLVIDADRVEAPVVAENLEGGEELYAHVYGPIPVGAVTKIVPVATTGTTFEVQWDQAVPRRS